MLSLKDAKTCACLASQLNAMANTNIADSFLKLGAFFLLKIHFYDDLKHLVKRLNYSTLYHLRGMCSFLVLGRFGTTKRIVYSNSTLNFHESSL